eukprot:1153525-Pelagomonas_calceolata.AAC.5
MTLVTGSATCAWVWGAEGVNSNQTSRIETEGSLWTCKLPVPQWLPGFGASLLVREPFLNAHSLLAGVDSFPFLFGTGMHEPSNLGGMHWRVHVVPLCSCCHLPAFVLLFFTPEYTDVIKTASFKKNTKFVPPEFALVPGEQAFKGL